MNAASQVPTVVVRRKISASAGDLFDAWLDPASLAVWMRPGGTPRTTANVDARVGGRFEIVMYTASGPISHTGTYQQIERPRRLVFTWNSPAAKNDDSLVTVEFRPAAGATEIVLTHERLPSADAVAAHTRGWGDILELIGQAYATARSTA